ncbi:MAG: dGTP triphosphohydrolase [Planctomycetota bacterium]
MPDFARDHPDPLAAGLPPLLVDRQRIVHSAAFRRLQQKTQVFVTPDSDHFRTRLTHTLEVAHQARCVAAALGLDADLAEVVALAHDLGHPPFGHAGERALDACLRDHGGFEHNRQTLRVVELLEHPYPDFHGLNLTRAVRQCLAAHETPYDRPAGLPEAAPPDSAPASGYKCSTATGIQPVSLPAPGSADLAAAPPESAVVDLADRLAYALHDLQDGLYAGLLDAGSLREVALWREAYTGPPGPAGWRGHLRPAIDRINQRLLSDVACRGGPLPRLSPDLAEQLQQLDRFLCKHVYRSPRLRQADDQARRIITAVFDAYVTHPAELPERFRRHVSAHGLPRAVADFVAGMTDRYCVEQHVRLADLPAT